MPARKVRVAGSALDGLGFVLPDERTPSGVLSFSDFLRFELAPLVDRLAVDFEGSTLPSGDGDVRLLLNVGVFVTSVCLFAYLDDDTVVVSRIMFDW